MRKSEKNKESGRTAFAVFAVVVMLIGVMAFMTSCKSSESGQAAGDGAKDQAEDVQDPAEEVLDKVVPAEDFDPVGNYEDETSQRAQMTISTDDDETYRVLISWSGSAFEMAIWEFEGKFDREGGMIPYKNCRKSIMKWDEEGNEFSETVYDDGEGALLFYENGFHWEDKKEDEGKDCHFVKAAKVE